MAKKIVDPLKYIESAFLDRPAGNSTVPKTKKLKLRKTSLQAPRPRVAKGAETSTTMTSKVELGDAWQNIPRTIELLTSLYDDGVTANYYRGEFKETREDLIKRLLDPQLSLEETSRLLGVCPATVRRYTNKGWLEHHRTEGGQRRFKLSDIVNFVEKHGRFPQA
jgi:excisionase family DNA binding protein